jgi:hypothetical protein
MAKQEQRMAAPQHPEVDLNGSNGPSVPQWFRRFKT